MSVVNWLCSSGSDAVCLASDVVDLVRDSWSILIVSFSVRISATDDSRERSDFVSLDVRRLSSFSCAAVSLCFTSSSCSHARSLSVHAQRFDTRELNRPASSLSLCRPLSAPCSPSPRYPRRSQSHLRRPTGQCSSCARSINNLTRLSSRLLPEPPRLLAHGPPFPRPIRRGQRVVRAWSRYFCGGYIVLSVDCLDRQLWVAYRSR